MLFLGSTISFGQELRNTNENVNTPNSVEYDSLKNVQFYNDSINNQILIVEQNINSIQLKWDWVMNDPDQKAIAESEEWFAKMTIVRQELEEKKQLLLNSLK
jgi:hypothetical protein